MATNDMWGSLPEVEDLKSPRTILQEQARILSDKTKHVLSANVVTTTSEHNLLTELFIVAPFLNDYQVGIVRITHGPLIYPLYFYDLLKSPFRATKCNDLAQFEEALVKTLSSADVRRVVASLLTQSKN